MQENKSTRVSNTSVEMSLYKELRARNTAMSDKSSCEGCNYQAAGKSQLHESRGVNRVARPQRSLWHYRVSPH